MRWKCWNEREPLVFRQWGRLCSKAVAHGMAEHWKKERNVSFICEGDVSHVIRSSLESVAIMSRFSSKPSRSPSIFTIRIISRASLTHIAVMRLACALQPNLGKSVHMFDRSTMRAVGGSQRVSVSGGLACRGECFRERSSETQSTCVAFGLDDQRSFTFQAFSFQQFLPFQPLAPAA